MRSPGAVLVLGLSLTTWSGCVTAAKVFLDIPDSQGTAQSATEISPELLAQLRVMPESPPPPPIEGVRDEAGILALLPADHSGGVDYVAALREGIIRPRRGLDEEDPDTVGTFSYDLYLSDGQGPEAYFPHSTHSEWLDCASCHPRVYRNGKASLSPATAHGSESCGYCHGPVAFPVQACERCHAAAENLPAGRRHKILNNALTMARAAPTGEKGGNDAFSGLDLTGSYPPASFPHDMHRLRFQCRACHERPFPMVSGATVMSRDDAHSGGGCGKCHNGSVAFDISIDACERCHVPPHG